MELQPVLSTLEMEPGPPVPFTALISRTRPQNNLTESSRSKTVEVDKGEGELKFSL